MLTFGKAADPLLLLAACHCTGLWLLYLPVPVILFDICGVGVVGTVVIVPLAQRCTVCWPRLLLPLLTRLIVV